MKIRVMYLDSGVGLAGGQQGLIEVLKNIDRSKYEPVVVSPKGSALMNRSRELSVEWHNLPFSSAHHTRKRRLSWLKDVIASMYAIPHLAFLAKRLRVDILVANTFKAAIITSFVSQMTHKPMIFYDQAFITHRPYDFLIRRTARMILTPSNKVMERYPPHLRAKIRIVPSGIDSRFLEINNDSAKSKDVGYLGRISREKGIDLLIRCFPKVLKHFPTTRLLIGGAPFTWDDRRYLEQLVDQVNLLKIGNNVQFVGFIDRVEYFLSNLRVLVLPSISETLGRVMLEAMAMGIPVVAFDSGGPSEVITHGETGLLVKPYDIDLMADSITRLLGDDDLVRRIGSKARMLVKEKYTSRVMVELLSSVFDELLGNLET